MWCLSRHPGLVVGCWSRGRAGGRCLGALLGVVGCLNQPIWPTAGMAVCSNIVPPDCSVLSGFIFIYRLCSWLEGRSLNLIFWITEWEQYHGKRGWLCLAFCCLLLAMFIQGVWKVGPVQIFFVYRGIFICIFCLLGSLLVFMATSECEDGFESHRMVCVRVLLLLHAQGCVLKGKNWHYLKESSIFLGASLSKFALTSAAEPLGVVRRGWPLLPLHFWAWAWFEGQGLEPPETMSSRTAESVWGALE